MEEYKFNAKQCRRCEYGFRASVEEGYICDYLDRVGKMRNCDTWPTCEKFEPRSKKKNKNKRPIIAANPRKLRVLDEFDIKVLRAYRENNRSVTKTMRAMNRTEMCIRYRLKKAQRITGLNPKVEDELERILNGGKKDEEGD